MWQKWTAFLAAHPKLNFFIVTVEGGMSGACISIGDDFVTGKLTFTREGLHKAFALVCSGIYIALRMAYFRNPKANA